MPVVDYEKKAELAEARLFRSDISEANLAYIERFLKAYDVSPARKAIFCRHIVFILENTTDIKEEMNDRDKINDLFLKMRGEYSDGYYATIINVSLVFVRWLNDGSKPEGFKDIKNLSRKKQKRDLDPSDMVSWEDGLELMSAVDSTQVKAVIAVQLDGGFRPSELIDLKYGDIELKKPFAIAYVQKSKTGEKRNVTLFRSVPYLQRWLMEHPTKDDDDPLWVIENPELSRRDEHTDGPLKYNYHALFRRIQRLAEDIGLDKPVDFYNLRHSACTLAKKDNLPLDLAAEKFGHTVKYFKNTYGRLSPEDTLNRHAAHYGEKENPVEKPKTILCGTCQYVNPPKTEYCRQCGAPLSIQAAEKVQDQTKAEVKEMRKQLIHQDEMIKRLQKFAEKHWETLQKD